MHFFYWVPFVYISSNIQFFFFNGCILRTIMALWRARSLTPEQKVQIVEEQSEASVVQTTEEDSIAKSLQATDEDETKSQIVDEESDSRSLRNEDSGAFLGVEDVNMSVVYSSILSMPVSIF